MAVCLVTGGAGFIGSHLVDALVARDHQVRVLDDFSRGSVTHLAGVRERIDLVTGDITDPDVVRAATAGIDWVFHQAALESSPPSAVDLLAVHRVCATGTLNVLTAARDAQVQRVIYAASASAYGSGSPVPRRETDATQPLTAVAVAKLCGEEYCALFTYLHGLETVRLRYFYPFGPRQCPQHPEAVVARLIAAMCTGQAPVIPGNGLQSRDWTYVSDVVQANLLAAEAPRVAGKVYNISCGRPTSLLTLVDHLNDILGTDLKPVHQHPPPEDLCQNQADISRAQIDLGFCPCTDLVQDLRRCVDYYTAASDEGQQLLRRPAPSLLGAF